MPHDRPTVCVFAPALYLTITIEAGVDSLDDIHLHPGGQGFWVARMIRELGHRPVVCGPVGGEAGRVIRGLIPEWKIDLSGVPIEHDSPAYVHDRRSGERVEVARSAPPTLDRHEVDDLYGRVMEHGVATGVCVVTGRVAGDTMPLDLFRRLGADLAEAAVTVIGDLHGDELDAVLEGGPIDILKVSEDDLADDGRLPERSDDAILEVMEALGHAGVRAVVVSRGENPAIARFGDRTYRAVPPKLEVVDFRGAGDSMTAALAVAATNRQDPETALRLASAAGAANVARHGLGSAPGGLIDGLADLVEIEEWIV